MPQRVNGIIDKATGKIIVQKTLPVFNCLVLEGGGVRCGALDGAGKVLEQYGLLKNIQYISASSGGAIASAFLAISSPHHKKNDKLSSIPMEKFLENTQSWYITPTIISHLRKAFSISRSKNKGLSSGVELYNWIKGVVKDVTGDENITFGQLAELAKKNKENNDGKQYRELFITATNISYADPETEIFCSEREPDVPIALAILASASFPGQFDMVDIKKRNGDTYKFIDGGFKKNMPADIFDNVKYLPKDAEITERLKNPGILIIKIDSRKEMLQGLYGVREIVEIESGSTFLNQLVNGATQTVDANETREARNVIVLPDNDIDILNFSIDANAKINLVTSAEKATLEYLENHIDAAYDVKTFESIQTWYDSLTLDEIDDLIGIYDDMKKDVPTLKEKKEKQVKPSKQEITEPDTPEFDPNKPTFEDLQDIITWLKFYVHYRRAKKRGTDVTVELKYPTKHINIKPLIDENRWDVLLRKDMELRLKVIKEQIASVEQKIKENSGVIDDLDTHKVIDVLHKDLLFDDVKLMAGLQEYLKLLRQERDELETKLGVKCEHKHDRDGSKEYIELSRCMKKLLDRGIDLSLGIRSVIKHFDLYEPKILFKSTLESDSTLFSLDMRSKLDVCQYLIAARLFLENRRYKDMEYRRSKNDVAFNDLYRIYFPQLEMPKDMYELSKMLNQDGFDLLMSAYRIEELMHFFWRTEQPTVKPTLDIDCLFKTSNYSYYLPAKSFKETNLTDVPLTMFTPNNKEMRKRLEDARMKIVKSGEFMEEDDYRKKVGNN